MRKLLRSLHRAPDSSLRRGRAILTHAVCAHIHENMHTCEHARTATQPSWRTASVWESSLPDFRLYFSMAILPGMCTVEFVHICAHTPFAPRVCTLASAFHIRTTTEIHVTYWLLSCVVSARRTMGNRSLFCLLSPQNKTLTGLTRDETNIL